MSIPFGSGAHHDGSEAYLSDPNPELGDTVTAFVRVPNDADVRRVVARTVNDAEPFRLEATLDRTSATEQWWRVDLRAHNPVTSYRFHLADGAGRTTWLTGEGLQAWDVPDTADFRLTTEHDPPAWVRETVWYQVFPDRFARRSDGGLEAPLPAWAHESGWNDAIETGEPGSMTQMYGGSLNGVTEHLDHLESLGVNGLYSCPFFPAHSNHRYDASAFDRVDPLLGGDDALRRLVTEAARRGIRVMGDLTTNHSGNHHEWFTSAMNDPEAPTRSYYSWREDGSYEAWLDVPSLPKFDHRSSALRAALYDGPDSITGRYLGDEFGLAAMRIDVANMTGRLRDVDLNRLCSTTLRATMRAVRPDAWLVAEHFHDASSDLDGGGWHGTMNYTGFTRPVWTWLLRDDVEISAFGEPGSLPIRSGRDAVRSARAFQSRIPYSVALTNMNLLGSHDTARWAYATGSPELHAVGVALLMTWPGSPSVFYGDEIGCGTDASYDVTARQTFPWSDRSGWNHDLLETYRELIALRTRSSALAVGGQRWISVGDDHLVFVRESRDERLLVHVSRTGHPPVRVGLGALGVGGAHVIAGADASVDGGSIRLEASGPTWRIVELTDPL
ncbi:MAG: glycoside hydrolase family 13 protein [Ilumatobacter sp.]|nr:glycoside hydrolase family 13 protein [Ilumatobacter sp.]